MYFINELKSNLKRYLKAVLSNDFNEFISSSYIPVTNAIVPPETPGITLATPIAIPFRNNKK